MLQVKLRKAQREDGHRAAYALLERVWRDLHGDTGMPRIIKTAEGKPCWADAAEQFSISHTRTAAACAVSDGPVGIDAETIRPIRRGVAQHSMNTEELEWIDRQPDFDRAFLRLWTMKEAWGKLLGCGLRGRPKGIVLSVQAEPLGVKDEDAYFVTQELDGVLVTVCTQKPEDVPGFEWEPEAQ